MERHLTLAHVGEVGRDFYRDQRAAARIADYLEAGLRAVENFEALLHIFHADSCTVVLDSGARTVAHAYAVVGYFDEHAVAGELAAQRYGSTVNARFEAMLDAVF